MFDQLPEKVQELTSMIGRRNLADFIVRGSAQGVHKHWLLSAESTEGFANRLGQIINPWCHQGHNDVLQLATQLILQVFDQILRVNAIDRVVS